MARKRFILYIEDDPDDVAILCDALETVSKNYSVIHARDGAEGLEKLHTLVNGNKPPCLIVLDGNMPKMNGRETIAALRRKKSYEQIPVVVFTTSPSEEDKNYFTQYGVDLLKKPASFTDFLAVASALLATCNNR